MVTQRDLDKLSQRLSDLIQGELEELSQDLMKLVEEDQKDHQEHQRMQLQRMSSLMVANKTLERSLQRLEKRVDDLETHHSRPKIQNIKVP